MYIIGIISINFVRVDDYRNKKKIMVLDKIRFEMFAKLNNLSI